ncbi:MAG: hypothetical protein ACLQVL_07725 [Terriglobia bacterium]
MADDDGRLLVGCIIGFGGGIYTFLKGFREYRKYRLVADTPKIRIRSVPMGVEQARLRHVTQMAGQGMGFVSRAIAPAHQSQGQSLLNMLADPTGAGAEGFRNQMVSAILARQDPGGEIARLALEVWKHPQGTPEFECALVRCAQAYSRTMATAKNAIDASAVLAQAHQNPQALAMIAAVAGAAEPQTDPEAEKARQAALAYGRGSLAGMGRQVAYIPIGCFRLKEHCRVPGRT